MDDFWAANEYATAWNGRISPTEIGDVWGTFIANFVPRGGGPLSGLTASSSVVDPLGANSVLWISPAFASKAKKLTLLDQARMAVPEPVSLCFHVTYAETQTNNLGVSLDAVSGVGNWYGKKTSDA